MARKKTIEVKGQKASLAYITEEEKKLLLARDKVKGSIAEKFHDGIPVLSYDDTLDESAGDDDSGNDDAGGDADLQNECEQAGGTWTNGSCVMPGDDDDDGGDDGDDDDDIDESWEKADPYQTIDEQDKIAKPGSETERVQEKYILVLPLLNL